MHFTSFILFLFGIFCVQTYIFTSKLNQSQSDTEKSSKKSKKDKSDKPSDSSTTAIERRTGSKEKSGTLADTDLVVSMTDPTVVSRTKQYMNGVQTVMKQLRANNDSNPCATADGIAATGGTMNKKRKIV